MIIKLIGLLLIIWGVVGLWKDYKEKHNTDSDKESTGFTDGPEDHRALIFAKLFVMITRKYYDCCTFQMNPEGIHMRFQDYSTNILRALIENNNPKAYLEVQECIGDDENLAGFLRRYGHQDRDYWIVDYPASISKSTANSAHTILASYPRLLLQKSDSNVYAHKASGLD